MRAERSFCRESEVNGQFFSRSVDHRRAEMGLNAGHRIDTQAAAGMGRRSRRGSMAIRAVVVVAIAGTVAAIGYAALGGSREEDGASTVAQTSDRAIVRTNSFQITTKASGELEARNQIEIRSRLESQSTIAELAPEGKFIKAGEMLIRLNSDKIEQDILEQTLQVESARAELVAAENGYNIQVNENESLIRQAVSKVTLAELALSQWEKGDVETMRLELKLDMEKAKRDFDRLKDKLERSEKLYSQGFLSKNELDLDKISFTEAEAAIKRADIANGAYEQYKHPEERETKTSALIEAKAEVERVKMNNEIELASKEAARTNRRKQLAVREEKLKNLETQLAAATMRAPSDGLVVYATSMSSGRGGGDREGPLQIGRQVYPNELLMILPDTSDMMASVRVQESLAGRIRAGQTATVQVDAAGGKTFHGAVESTSVLAETGGWRDPNLREYTVKVALDQEALQGAGLKPSMRVDASIILGEVQDAVAVPVQAVFNEGPVRFVYAQESGKFIKVPVKMGRRSDAFAEITAGLSEGDVVLLREPTAGEVLLRPWDKAKLELAGYSLGEDGHPTIPGAGGGRGGPGGPGGGGGGQRGSRERGRGDQTTAEKTPADAATAADRSKTDGPAAGRPQDGKPGRAAETDAVATKPAKVEQAGEGTDAKAPEPAATGEAEASESADAKATQAGTVKADASTGKDSK
jgi:HlyD family secretion protein